MDYTPSAFETGKIYGLPIFIKLAQQDANFGLLIDTIRWWVPVEEETTEPSDKGELTIAPEETTQPISYTGTIAPQTAPAWRILRRADSPGFR